MLTPRDIQKMEASLADAGATVDQLCAEAGVDRSTWSRWKAGTFMPRWDTWNAATEAFNRLTHLSSNATNHSASNDARYDDPPAPQQPAGKSTAVAPTGTGAA